MLYSKVQKLIVSNYLLIKKAFISQIKLQYLWQRTSSHSSIIKNLKNIYKKNTKTQYLYKLKVPIILHNYKVVKVIISMIVWVSRIIQVYNILYSKKKR